MAGLIVRKQISLVSTQTDQVNRLNPSQRSCRTELCRHLQITTYSTHGIVHKLDHQLSRIIADHEAWTFAW